MAQTRLFQEAVFPSELLQKREIAGDPDKPQPGLEPTIARKSHFFSTGVA